MKDDPRESPAEPVSRARRDTRADLLAAAETCLRRDGYAELSTRRVAEEAGVALSQIHYHFGSKERLILSLLDYLNERLLKRQAAAFAAQMPLWRRWERACDFLDEDLASGYVRVLHEMIAASWSSPEIAKAVRRDLRGWFELLAGLAEEAAERFGSLGQFSPAEVASLVSAAFLGSETMILLDIESRHVPVRQALRRFGETIRQMEEAAIVQASSTMRT
ncbi:TetR/AcrR family transcriptional regulator [Mesorhizobium sp. LHD-90]|uniref:TetR/AcrR family transcriptional regulator n=1 Tax=Mesorhizobium sp. LHD-90 TaxID=3071414 RepID=UPI0027E13FDA|nr:TetR/AcrR family transcriptional regulator [Mesorhizobium sp. LHD-90]MDQ6436006.1 TetR/AcrR family transcriptional regulator [Mesorhizobium sp. LHD-90]